MRHRNKKGRLSRRTSWRKATLKCLANDILKYQRIETTLAKAKVLRSYVEPLITMAKNDPEAVSARRKAFQKLSDRSTVKTLFTEIAPLYKDTPGGYTRIMALGTREGDGAPMAIIELTKRTISDDKLLRKDKVKEKAKTRRKAQKAGKPAKGEKLTERHSAPDVTAEEKEERMVEDVKKEKAKREQKKIEKKGFFRRFQRKSMG